MKVGIRLQLFPKHRPYQKGIVQPYSLAQKLSLKSIITLKPCLSNIKRPQRILAPQNTPVSIRAIIDYMTPGPKDGFCGWRCSQARSRFHNIEY